MTALLQLLHVALKSVLNSHTSALPWTRAEKVRNVSSGSCFIAKSSARKIPRATGMTATDFSICRASFNGFVVNLGSARKTMFPSCSLIHSKSWPDAVASCIPDPSLNDSQRRKKASQSSLVEFKASLGRSSFGPREGAGAGAGGGAAMCMLLWTVRMAAAPTTSTSCVANPHPGIGQVRIVINSACRGRQRSESVLCLLFHSNVD